MTGAPLEIVRANILRLMDLHDIENKKDLAERAGVDPKTFHNLMNPEVNANPTLATLEKVAAALGVAVWQVCMPNLPVDQSLNRRLRAGLTPSAYALCAVYTSVPQPSQREIDSFVAWIAERERAR